MDKSVKRVASNLRGTKKVPHGDSKLDIASGKARFWSNMDS